jgi:hypothetical protein
MNVGPVVGRLKSESGMVVGMNTNRTEQNVV